jgi:hypothetical protein
LCVVYKSERRTIGCVQLIIYYPTPENVFQPRFPKQPASRGRRTHNYRLFVAYIAPALLVNTRTAEGWSCAEVGGMVRVVRAAIYFTMSPDSAVGIATGYGLEGQGFGVWCKILLSTSSSPVLRLPSGC